MQKDRYSLVILLFILFAVYCFIFGESGILERRRLAGGMVELEKKIVSLERENARLIKLNERYKKGEFLKDEALKSGYVSEGEKVLFFKSAGEKRRDDKPAAAGDEELSVNIDHLRVLWVVISLMLLLIYFIVRARYRKTL